MRVGSLFAGIGGFDLGLERAGMEVVWQVEIDPFCNKVLAKHWPDVKRYRDVKEVGKHNLEPVDLICGGFPCQPFSVAGKRKGKEDGRALWPEMFRIISECRPRWVIGENVAGFINMGLDESISDLEGIGYEVQTFVIPACAVNAPHRRDRVWIIAHSGGNGFGGRSQHEGGKGINVSARPVTNFDADSHAPHSPLDLLNGTGGTRGGRAEPTDGGGDAADAGNAGLEGSKRPGPLPGRTTGAHGAITERIGNPAWSEDWPQVATRLCGIFNGLSTFMDEIGGLNAKTAESITGQIMPYLWHYIQQEKIWESLGGGSSVLNETNLFAILWKHFIASNERIDLPFESEEVQEAFMRNVWVEVQLGCTPQRWAYREQRAGEFADTLPRLSHEIALETQSIVRQYNAHRVDRLKALGNAVVPAIVTIIGRAIMEVECAGS